MQGVYLTMVKRSIFRMIIQYLGHHPPTINHQHQTENLLTSQVILPGIHKMGFHRDSRQRIPSEPHNQHSSTIVQVQLLSAV